jgi:hypothetical protein
MEYTNTQITHLINERIHRERDRKILIRRLVDGVCYEPLAEEFDMSVRGIKYVVYNAQKVLFDAVSAK